MRNASTTRAVAVGTFLAAAACGGYDIRATDGRIVHQSSWGDWQETIRASGARDLACDSVTVGLASTDLYTAEGCGYRATYGINVRRGEDQAILVGLTPLRVAPPAAGP
jgi:hypothetical protein